MKCVVKYETGSAGAVGTLGERKEKWEDERIENISFIFPIYQYNMQISKIACHLFVIMPTDML